MECGPFFHAVGEGKKKPTKKKKKKVNPSETPVDGINNGEGTSRSGKGHVVDVSMGGLLWMMLLFHTVLSCFIII